MFNIEKYNCIIYQQCIHVFLYFSVFILAFFFVKNDTLMISLCNSKISRYFSFCLPNKLSTFTISIAVGKSQQRRCLMAYSLPLTFSYPSTCELGIFLYPCMVLGYRFGCALMGQTKFLKCA